MCTAISYKTRTHYFGRNLDMECSFGEDVVVMPRGYPFTFRHAERPEKCYAIIGTAIVREGVPLFYDGANEKGLAIAGLNFVGNTQFYSLHDEKVNIAPFELIPWILGRCATVSEAEKQMIKEQAAATSPLTAAP